ncbi:MAG: hypothetical protein ACYSTI_11530 [Planctomycetota bacterium]|jgi:hypothetical protein
MNKVPQIISVAVVLVVTVVLSSQPVQPVEAASIPADTAKAILDKNFPYGIKGMCFETTPTDYFIPAPVKYGNTDFAVNSFRALWDVNSKGITRTIHFPGGTTKSQGDLQTLKDMGANLLRLYFWAGGNDGTNPWPGANHQSFLTKCDALGIKLIVPIFITDSPDFKNTVYFKNIEFIVNHTYNHPSVVFYAIGNEIDPTKEPQVFNNIKISAERIRELLNNNGGEQLICSPTFPSDEAMGWFTSRGVEIDVWGFNTYDPDQLQKLYVGMSNKILNGHPFFASEFGVPALDTRSYVQNESMQAGAAPTMINKIFDNLDKIYGGCWFEYSDERWKGLTEIANGCGGGVDKTIPASTYVSQVGGSIPTFVGHAPQPVPASSVGHCTWGWEIAWTPDQCMNEGYFGMSYLMDVGKTAETVLPFGGDFGSKPYIYRVDDLHLRTVYTPLMHEYIQKSIDIVPHTTMNFVDHRSQGRVPVAILSTDNFNAPESVNQDTLTFGRTGDEQSHSHCNTEDVDRDGDLDLVCFFNIPETGIQPGDKEAVLKGETVSGVTFAATDSIRAFGIDTSKINERIRALVRRIRERIRR